MTEEITPTENVETKEIEGTPREGEGEVKPTEDVETEEVSAEELQTQLADEKEQRRKAEGRLGYFEREAQRRQKEEETKITIEKPTETITRLKPVEKDFTDYTEFVEALTDWKSEQRDATNKASQEKLRQQEQAITFQEKLNEGNTKYKDFDAVARNNDVPITVVMRDAMIGCEHPADIAYYLGGNLTEAHRIASLSPIAAAREIGKLEARFSGPIQKTITKAPGATKDITGKETSVKDFDKMTDDDAEDYINQRNRQEREELGA